MVMAGIVPIVPSGVQLICLFRDLCYLLLKVGEPECLQYFSWRAGFERPKLTEARTDWNGHSRRS